MKMNSFYQVGNRMCMDNLCVKVNPSGNLGYSSPQLEFQSFGHIFHTLETPKEHLTHTSGNLGFAVDNFRKMILILPRGELMFKNWRMR